MPPQPILEGIYSKESALAEKGKRKKPEQPVNPAPWEPSFWSKEPTSKDEEPISRKTANGRLLWFHPYSSKGEVDMALELYAHSLQHSRDLIVREVVTKALTVWFQICGGLLGLGLVVSWVKKGFRPA